MTEAIQIAFERMIATKEAKRKERQETSVPKLTKPNRVRKTKIAEDPNYKPPITVSFR